MLNYVMAIPTAYNTIQLNKKLARNLGVYNALFYLELARVRHELEEQNKLPEDEFFRCDNDRLEYDSLVPQNYHEQCIKSLKEHNLLETCLRGNPSCRYYKLTDDDAKIISLMTK